LYESYFIVDSIEDINIYYFTSNGYISFEDFDTYKMESSSLIAFLDNPDNYWITNYKLEYEQKSHILQSQYYEKVLDILNEENVYNESVHAFSNSVEVYENNSLGSSVYDLSQRCDYNKYGPTAFYPPSANRKLGKILQFRNLLSVTGTAHLLRIDLESISQAYDDNSSNQAMNQTARTFGGAMKLIHEWKEVSQDPWNNEEPIAQKSNLFLQSLNIPEETVQELLANQCDMRVVKYLQGEASLNQEMPETGYISESFKRYLIDNYRYKSIKNLKNQHSLGSSIDDSIAELENTILNQAVSFYCLVNGIDKTEMTLEQISDHAYKNATHVDKNNSITDIIRQLTV
jgi:hypothetical protein